MSSLISGLAFVPPCPTAAVLLSGRAHWRQRWGEAGLCPWPCGSEPRMFSQDQLDRSSPAGSPSACWWLTRAQQEQGGPGSWPTAASQGPDHPSHGAPRGPRTPKEQWQGALMEQLTMALGVKGAQDHGEQRMWRSGGQWWGQAPAAAGAEMATSLRGRAAACECRGRGVPLQRRDMARLPRGSGPRALKGERSAPGDGCGRGSERHPVQTGTSSHTSLRPQTKSHVLNTTPRCSCLSARREARTEVPTLQEGRRLREAHGLPKATEPASGSSPGLLMPQPGACAPHPASPRRWTWVSLSSQRTGWKSSLGRGEKTLPVRAERSAQ